MCEGSGLRVPAPRCMVDTAVPYNMYFWASELGPAPVFIVDRRLIMAGSFFVVLAAHVVKVLKYVSALLKVAMS